MPQPLDPLALAAAYGVPGRRVAAAGDLAGDLARQLAWALPQPMALLELVTDRRADASLRQALRRMASTAMLQP